MDKRVIAFAAVYFLVAVVPAHKPAALAYGSALSHPLIRRTFITQGYFPGHEAYDYRSDHTVLVAPKAGEIISAYWGRADGWTWSCDGTWRARGNWIILDHHPGGLRTYYYHLSNTGNTPGSGTSFQRGGYMALTDDTGCSSGDHLHFAVRVNGAPVDPYAGGTEWVGGGPIPMGYVDQTGAARGPFLLSLPEIRDQWLALAGNAGSPLGSDYPVGWGKCRQDFERGYIEAYSAYCPYLAGDPQSPTQPQAGSLVYHAYQRISLPDIRAHRLADGGWNSTVIVRNDGPGATDVTLTILQPDGKVKDARTYRGLPDNATWTVHVRDVVYDPLLNDWSHDFRGSAVVTASKDVSVVVTQGRSSPEAWAAYNGVRSPQARVHVPVLHRNNYGWDSQIFIQNSGSAPSTPTVQFTPSTGYPGSPCTYRPPAAIPAGGQLRVDLEALPCVGPTFVGSAYLQADQPLAVARTQYLGSSMLMESSRDGGAEGGASGTVHAPIVQNDNYGWFSGIAAQNAAGVSQALYLKYHRNDHGLICHALSAHVGSRRVWMIPGPPLGGNQGGGCVSVLTARLFGYGHNTAGNVNQLLPGTSYATDYPLVAAPGLTVSAPVLMKGWQGWRSGINVLNTSGLATDITIAYYRADGSLAARRSARLTNRGAAWVVYPLPVGDGFYGSARITASRPVAVSINHLKSGGDGIMSHIGLHR